MTAGERMAKLINDGLKARPLIEWHEGVGEVLWWRFPVREAPYVGSPLCDDWTENYYTHFTRFEIPDAP